MLSRKHQLVKLFTHAQSGFLGAWNCVDDAVNSVVTHKNAAYKKAANHLLTGRYQRGLHCSQAPPSFLSLTVQKSRESRLVSFLP